MSHGAHLVESNSRPRQDRRGTVVGDDAGTTAERDHGRGPSKRAACATSPDVDRVADALRGEFDVDDRAVARAVRARSCVNSFHRASAIKAQAASLSPGVGGENCNSEAHVILSFDRDLPGRPWRGWGTA